MAIATDRVTGNRCLICRAVAQQGDQRGPVRYAELAVSGRQVMLDRAGTEEELLRNGPGVGTVSCRQDDIAFPGRQSAQVCGGHHYRMPHGPDLAWFHPCRVWRERVGAPMRGPALMFTMSRVPGTSRR